MKVIAPYISCIVWIPSESGEDEMAQALSEGYQMIYMVTPEGLFLHRRLKPGKDGMERFVRSKIDSIPGVKLPKVTEAINFLPAGKIPVTLLHYVEDFFRQVINVRKTAVEAMIWIMWSEENGYFLHVPKQTVSKASASYDWNDLPANSSIIVDIHSHADFNAFFSGTDDGDDRNRVGISGVIGHNDKEKRSYAWRFNNTASKIPLTMEDIFDQPRAVTQVPNEWIEKVGTYSPPAVQRYQGGGYAMGQGGYTGFTGHSGVNRANSELRNRHSFYPDQEKSPTGQGTGQSTKGKKKQVKQSNESNVKKLDQSNVVQYLPDGSIMVTDNGTIRRMDPKEMQRFITNDLKASRRAPEVAEDVPEEDLGFAPESLQHDLFYQMLMSDNSKDADDALARMHERAQQEALVGTQPDEPEIPEGAYTEERDGVTFIRRHEIRDVEMKLSPDGSLRITVPAEDMPGDFDAMAINHGTEAAMASAALAALVPRLGDDKDALKELTEDVFALVPEDQKLDLVRSLVQMLPDSALESLQTNGL